MAATTSILTHNEDVFVVDDVDDGVGGGKDDSWNNPINSIGTCTTHPKKINKI